MNTAPGPSPKPRRRPLGLRFAMGLHRWVALPLALFLILFAASGIILNHRSTVSRLGVSRKVLPTEFRFKHWNNAAVKGSLQLSDDSCLLYGHTGIWKTNSGFLALQDYSHGLPRGAGRRSVECLFKTTHGDVLAGNRYGMYRLKDSMWTDVACAHVVDFAQRKDQLYVLTRSHLLSAPVDDLSALKIQPLRPPPGWDGKVPLLRVVWKLHNGELFGRLGHLVVDLLGISMIVLAVSGTWLFWVPKHMRKRKRKGHRVIGLAASARSNRVWHRRIGIAVVFLLLISTVSGMLLRPPFLLAIIRSRVEAWPGTSLRDVGPWHDRLRRMIYDVDTDTFIIATGDGIYSFDAAFEESPKLMRRQPPVSVMGVTVFEPVGPGRYLVGSFSGLYLWIPEKSILMNWITKGPPPDRKPRLPFGEHMVSGYIRGPNSEDYVFDYRRGALPLGHAKAFPDMPDGVKNTPMSLWRLALETHTGRIYQSVLGQGQLLWVAVTGLLTTFILLSGILWWLQTHSKTRQTAT